MARDMNVGPAAEKKLEQYGVWVKVEPRSVSPGRQPPPKLTDLEQSPVESPQKAPTISEEEEQLLGELDAEMIQGESEELPVIELEATTATAAKPSRPSEPLAAEPADLELEELPEEEEVEVPLAEEAGESASPGRFVDLEALEEEIAATPEPVKTVGRQQPAAALSVASPEILTRIEAELRSIRTDLTELKKELAGLHQAPAAPAAEAAATAEEAASGFFEEAEEEDDTIALTGDELDNILNTADITEEAAEPQAAATDLDIEPVLEVALEPTAGLSDQPDILSYEDSPAPAPTAEVAEALEAVEEATEAPAELSLDDIVETTSAEPAIGEIDLDLEGIPEIEELETPAPMESASVTEGDLEELEELEEVADLEEVEGPTATNRGPAAASEAPQEIEDVDLEALANQQADEEPILSTDDISEADIAELEAVAEDEGAGTGEKAIEIDFEAAPPAAEPAAEPVAEALAEAEPLVTELDAEPVEVREKPAKAATPAVVPDDLKDEIRKVLKYLDQLLEALPEDKIQEFASSDYFAMYRKLFEDLGLGN